MTYDKPPRSFTFEVVDDPEARAALADDEAGPVVREHVRRPMAPSGRRDPSRAIAPLFNCYQALLSLHDRSEVEEAAKNAVWKQLTQVREAEDPQ